MIILSNLVPRSIFLLCRQGMSTIDEYLAHFEELLYNCDIYKTPYVAVSRFLNGLNLEIASDNFLASQSLDKAYQQAYC